MPNLEHCPVTECEDVDAHAVPTSARRVPWRAVALEVTASLLAAGAVVMIPLHYFGARVTFLGAEAVIHHEDVHFYWTLVGVLAVAVIASFAGALWRRGNKAFASHILIAVAGVVVASAFSVTEAGPVQDLDLDDPVKQEQPDHPGSSVCHSGGDSDECVGG
jgi:hypothetical protein